MVVPKKFSAKLKAREAKQQELEGAGSCYQKIANR